MHQRPRGRFGGLGVHPGPLPRPIDSARQRPLSIINRPGQGTRLLSSPVFGLSRNFDDQQRQTHTETPILTGFSVVSARSGTVAIESAGEPVFGALSSKLFG